MSFLAYGDFHVPVFGLGFITDRSDSGWTRELAIATKTLLSVLWFSTIVAFASSHNIRSHERHI